MNLKLTNYKLYQILTLVLYAFIMCFLFVILHELSHITIANFFYLKPEKINQCSSSQHHEHCPARDPVLLKCAGHRSFFFFFFSPMEEIYLGMLHRQHRTDADIF